MTGAVLPICVILYFFKHLILKISCFLSENSEPFAFILCLQLQDMLDLLGCLLCFLSYFRMIDLSCRLPHLSGPASKELVWQLFFHPFVNDRKWQPWLFQFFSHLYTVDIFLFRKLPKFGYFLTIPSEENSLNKRDIAHILLYDSELMATLAVNFLQTISTSTRQVVLWISSFA